jgi:hypothetical protein
MDERARAGAPTRVALFHPQLTLHFLVPQSTEVRAFEWESPDLIGSELYCNGLAFWQFLVDMEGFELESVVSIERCNDQPDMIASLDLDHVGGKFVFPGSHPDLAGPTC